jgi:hypothetical protein
MKCTLGVGAALAVLALAFAACGGTTEVDKPAASTAPAAAPTTVATTPPPAAASATSPPTTAATSGSAHVGATLSLTGEGGDQANVTLSQVIDPATGTDGPPTDDNGNPENDVYVETVLNITNTGSGSYQDDANSDATLIGSDGQSYSPDFDDVAECTNFSSGSYQLGPGESANGCVVFVLPDGVSPTKFQYGLDSDFGSNFGEWKIP